MVFRFQQSVTCRHEHGRKGGSLQGSPRQRQQPRAADAPSRAADALKQRTCSGRRTYERHQIYIADVHAHFQCCRRDHDRVSCSREGLFRVFAPAAIETAVVREYLDVPAAGQGRR